MKMIYLQRNKKNFSVIKKIIIAVVIFLTYILFSLFFRNSTSAILHNISVPFWKSWNFTRLSISKGFSFLSSKNSLIKENLTLKNKISKLERSVVDISSERLFKKVGIDIKREENTIKAEILKSPPQSPYDVVILSKGRNDGIEAGYFVLSGQNIILGTIKKVLGNTSEAIFFSSAGISKKASILRSGVPVEIVGRGGGSFEMSVPKGTDILEGDLVIEKNGNYVIAIIEVIEGEETSSFNKIFARTPVNLFTLSVVEIIPPKYDI